MTDPLARLTAALADRYRIERELGQGGMATVYLAHDVKHDRQVAVKVLRPELAAVIGAERFVQEIKTTANLSHPHILPLFDSGTADSFLYYVMPFIDGETLRGKLNRETQLGIEESIRITREVADALEYAHQHGVVHRDIKPENILLQNGRPMVADFGIALAVSAAAGGRMTETGLSVGTPHYMSPEQATAEKDLTARADIYSLASVLYEMLTGSPPHVGASAQQIIMKIVTDQARPIGELRKSVPPHVAAAAAKALEKLPADRFESAAAFSAALANPGFTLAGTTAPAAVGGSARRTGLLVRWGVAAGVGLVAVIAAVLLVRGGAEEQEVVRFHLSLPGRARLFVPSGEDAPFALSPDGSQIVYAAIDSGAGTSRLYLRALDQIEGTPIQGTEDAIAPFFSPDGRWVGFATYDDLMLKKVPVTGGPAITLAEDVQNGFGGASWGDDGNIVYMSSGYLLSRVPGTGGVPEKLATADSAGDGMFWPSVLPGGETVLYQRCFSTCSQKDLVVLDLATGSVEVVVPGATRGWYIPTGHLIYATDNGAVYAVPFDLKSREVNGSPVPVLDQVRAGDANGSRLAISPAGAMIYLPGASASGVQLVEVDRSGRDKVVLSEFGRYEHPRWSPTGDRIALTIGAGTGNQIWIYDVASETLTQLTSEGTSDRPTWSPDGSRVAYRRFDGSGVSLAWSPADGSGPSEPIGKGVLPGGAGTTFWTRDGAWIVTDGLADSTKQDEDVFAVSTGAERTRQVAVATPAEEETGSVSPDGKWLAYGSDEGGQWQVYIRPFLTPGGRWLVSTGGAGNPLWASNSEVVYNDFTTRSLVAAKLTFGPTVRVTERIRLFGWDPYYYGSSSAPQYDVSRDGQRFLMLREQLSSQRVTEPIVVLNWFKEVKRRMAEQGGR